MKLTTKQLTLLIISFLSNHLSAQYNDTLRIDYFGQTPPGKTAVVFAPDFISKPGLFLQNCCFSPDGKEFYYCVTDENWSFSSLYVSKYSDGKWSTPKEISKDVNVFTPIFSSDGKSLFFAGWNPATNSGDISVMKINNTGFESPVRYSEPINTGSQEFEVAIAKNGNMYFSSDRSGGFGKTDIYRSIFKDGVYQSPENLGAPINGFDMDECPYIAPDESYMVINSWKYSAFAGNNLYITYRKEDGSWTNPKDLGKGVNTDLLDIYPYITPDGKYLMFTRRNGAYPATDSRLYWVSTAIFDSVKKSDTQPYQKCIVQDDTLFSGQTYSFTFPKNIFSDDDKDDSLSYNVIQSNGKPLPEWLTFDSKTMKLTGTAPSVKFLSIGMRITATDKAGKSCYAGFYLFVMYPTDIRTKVLINNIAIDNNSHRIIIDLKQVNNLKVYVYDISGKTLRTETYKSSNQVIINSSGLSSGIYILKTISGEITETRKINIK